MINKIIGGLTILVVVIIAAINVNLDSQKRTFPIVSLSDKEALAQESAGWNHAIHQQIVTCRSWGIDPSTGEPCYIDVEMTKTTCPAGGLPCTPFSPC
jgi:hypothetical protein